MVDIVMLSILPESNSSDMKPGTVHTGIRPGHTCRNARNLDDRRRTATIVAWRRNGELRSAGMTPV